MHLLDGDDPVSVLEMLLPEATHHWQTLARVVTTDAAA
ncbi:hypothetical protein DFP91_2458 [Pseudorhodoplanes sinuspersici]|nr:hypothetical protein DFP91_2458 [Pseudorhodoplanes sinuspersici]